MATSMTPNHAPGETLVPRRLLTIADLQALLRCGRTTAYLRVHDEDFPTPVVFSGSAHRWWEHEVLDWIETHRRERCGSLPLPRVEEGSAPRPRPVELRRRRASS